MYLMNRPRVYRSTPKYKSTHSTSANFRPSVNVLENETSFKILMALPGFQREDLSITIEDEVLTITSEKTWEQAESDRWTHKEFKLGTFKRSFVLPTNIDANQIEAKVENGLLEINLAKKAKQTIAIA
ncbi:MAG: Hsp20/alpha crystallin family protein [Bacteroidota bacterium]